MIDKELVQKRFKKSLETYDDNAIVQKIMAKKLVEMIPDRNFLKVFEIGCGSGLLTRLIKEKINPKEYFVNDIVYDCEKYIKKIVPDAKFFQGDIEKIDVKDKFDLIISNAALQWCDDLNKVCEKLKNMLNHQGILAFTVFAQDNFYEMKSVLDMNLYYQPPKNLDTIKIFPMKPEILWFDSPKDVLKHLKLTGVNALKQEVWGKDKLKNFENKYRKLFEENGRVSLTYKPVCVVFENID